MKTYRSTQVFHDFLYEPYTQCYKPRSYKRFTVCIMIKFNVDVRQFRAETSKLSGITPNYLTWIML